MKCIGFMFVFFDRYRLLRNDVAAEENIFDVADLAETFHYENMPMHYTEIFKVVKNENFQ